MPENTIFVKRKTVFQNLPHSFRRMDKAVRFLVFFLHSNLFRKNGIHLDLTLRNKNRALYFAVRRDRKFSSFSVNYLYIINFRCIQASKGLKLNSTPSICSPDALFCLILKKVVTDLTFNLPKIQNSIGKSIRISLMNGQKRAQGAPISGLNLHCN